jgi:hypothetical protein
MLLGAWTIIFLFLGFPIGWEEILAALTGLVVVIMAYRMPSPIKESKNPSAIPFVEHKSEYKNDSPSTMSVPEEKKNPDTIINPDQTLTS